MVRMIRSFLVVALLGASAAVAQERQETAVVLDPRLGCFLEAPEEKKDDSRALEPSEPLDRYPELAKKHRLSGRACYYSSFFHGRKTANGEIYRNDRHSAAHLTLPLGTWVEVRSLATGKKLRLRVNDRGPYSGGFVLDLSQAAARKLGVDRARDRRVEIRVLALPGDELPPDEDEVQIAEEGKASGSQADGSVAQNVDP